MALDIVWDEMIIPIEKGYIRYVREYVYDNEDSLLNNNTKNRDVVR